MASHEVRIGSTVHTSDNKNVGEVHQLVIDPKTRLVNSLVAKISGAERMIDVELIASSNQDGVWLSIPQFRAEVLPPFVHETVTHVTDWRNIAFGAGPVTSMGSTGGAVAYGPGQYGSPVSQPFFSTAPIGTVVTETVSDVPEGDTSVGKGTEVRGSDNKKIGHVHDVIFDDEEQITGFLVKSGFIFHKDEEIPISAISFIGHDHVRLNISADEAKSQYGQ
jgi:uncharacterized protein YrrD